MPETILVASARPDGDSLIALPDENAGSSKPRTAAPVPKTKNPRSYEMLPGVVYDLKRTRDLEPTELSGSDVASLMSNFVNGSYDTWWKDTGGNGFTEYPHFSRYCLLPTRLLNSFFYLQHIEPSDVPKKLHAESGLEDGGWIAVYSGYVVAPFTGTFRFVGFVEDSLLAVRFNKNIVLKCKKKSGLQQGDPITVRKGQYFSIEIAISEYDKNAFSTMLFVEQLDANGNPRNASPEKLPLFRTTAHLPPHPTLDSLPDFEESGPIWKVVDPNGNPIPLNRYAKEKYSIGFQEDEPDKADAGNYEDELPGVLYDLKMTSEGESTGLMEMQAGKQFNRMRTVLSVWDLPDTSGKESVMVPYLKRFVVSNWPSKSDSTGFVSFNEFRQFSRSPVNPYRSYFYLPITSSANAPKSYSGDGTVSDAGWVGINSGYVVAPFTGKFRFVGFGDDALVVRFNNQIVLDYGWYALSLGKMLDDTWNYKAILGGTAAKTDPQNRMVLNNPVYSQCKLETYFPSMFDGHGLAKGVPISVTKGKHYPIQILVTDIVSGSFGTALFIEQLDSNGVPLKNDPAKLPLFRTSSALPGHSSGSGFPDFDEDSPIWKVVDSKGKPIPSHKPPVVEQKQVDEKNKNDAASKNESTASQPKRDPNLRKTVTKTTRGNVTTETVTEYNGDTTVETVTTTEVNGDTTVQTTARTETKNGVVVKKTSSTTTTTNVKQPANSSSSSAQNGGTEKTATPSKSNAPAASNSQKEPDKKQDKPAYNPFGYTQPLPEDD